MIFILEKLNFDNLYFRTTSKRAKMDDETFRNFADLIDKIFWLSYKRWVEAFKLKDDDTRNTINAVIPVLRKFRYLLIDLHSSSLVQMVTCRPDYIAIRTVGGELHESHIDCEAEQQILRDFIAHVLEV